MTDPITLEILEPLQRGYYPPRSLTEEQQLEQLRLYRRILQGFSVDELRAAWDDVLRTWVKTSWPPPGVIYKAAKQAQTLNPSKAPKPEHLATASQRVWETIRKTPLAQQAAAEGWAWSLKSRVLDGTLTTEGQINVADFQRAHRSAQRLADRLEHDADNRFAAHVRSEGLRLYRQILIREAYTRQEIFS